MKRFSYALFVVIVLACLPSKAQNPGNDALLSDSALFVRIVAQLESYKGEGVDKLFVRSALSFEGIPYVGKTLEGNNVESLVVNLRELDCSTFIESALAIALTVKSDDMSFSNYKDNLEKLRYRGGLINGYQSRLHYFSDWIYENSQRKVVRDVTRDFGGIVYNKSINFMSTHSSSYKQLSGDSVMIGLIAAIESKISDRPYYYIPKANVANIEDRLLEGMIVAITTGIDGLDIAHVGILIKKDGRVHLLHASSDAGKVEISEKTFSEYLAGNKRQTGIMLLQLME